MALKTITKFVVNYSEIPTDLAENNWINGRKDVAYLEVHIDGEDSGEDALSNWLSKTYPELVEEDSFYIHMDS